MTASARPRAPRRRPRREAQARRRIHDVEPATFERCALIRDWLDDLGVDTRHAARDPRAAAAPLPGALAGARQLAARPRDAGDAIAQHGLQHRRTRRPARFTRTVRGWQGGQAAEYPGLDEEATTPSVDTGRKVLTEAGPGAARVRRARLRVHARAAAPPEHPLRLVGDAARRCAARAPRTRPRSASARATPSSAPPHPP